MAGKREDNVTRRHIEEKKRALARMRRRRFLRRMLALTICTVLLLLAAGGVYALICGAEYVTQEYHEMYTGYTERRASWQGDTNPQFDGYTNILVMGLDDGADRTNTEGAKADTVLVLSLDNQSGKVRFITIPGDTWVNPPGTAKFMRMSSVYTAGGAPLMVREVNQLLGIPIHQYVALDLKAFAELIDALGGIDIYVESDMDYEDPEANLNIHLKKGYQHLDGSQAQQYLRYRSPELGDVGREQRQQRFVKALYQQVLRLETIPRLPVIAEIFRKHVKTSAEIFDSAHLANVLRHLSSDPPEGVILQGAPSLGDDTIWMPDNNGIRQQMKKLFPEAEGSSSDAS